MFFLQVFFYICLWIVEVFSRSDVSSNITEKMNERKFNEIQKNLTVTQKIKHNKNYHKALKTTPWRMIN